jgi:hypothetical protein
MLHPPALATASFFVPQCIWFQGAGGTPGTRAPGRRRGDVAPHDRPKRLLAWALWWLTRKTVARLADGRRAFWASFFQGLHENARTAHLGQVPLGRAASSGLHDFSGVSDSPKPAGANRLRITDDARSTACPGTPAGAPYSESRWRSCFAKTVAILLCERRIIFRAARGSPSERRVQHVMICAQSDASSVLIRYLVDPAWFAPSMDLRHLVCVQISAGSEV